MTNNVQTQDLASLQSQLTQAIAVEAQGNYDEAERLVHQILAALSSPDLAKQAYKERAAVHAGATRMLGIVCWRRGSYPQALDHLQNALQGSQQIDDQAGIAKSLGNIGNVYNSLSDYPKALEYYVKGLGIAEELGDKWGVAGVLGNVGNVYNNLSDYPRALEYHVKALSIAEELGNKAGVAIHLGNIGTVHMNLSDYQKALEYYGKALSIDEGLGNKAGVSRHLGNIGSVHSSLSDYSKALEYNGKALSLHEELGNMSGVATCLGNIGNVHVYLSDYPKALEYFGKALSLAEELGHKLGVARNLGGIGAVHKELGDYEMAFEYFGKALRLDEELGNKSGAALWLSNIGMVHKDISDFAKALEYSKRALLIQEELGNRKDAADTKASLGALNAHTANPNRDHAKAETLLREAIAESQELGTRTYDAHKTLAELYEGQGRLQEAITELKKYHELEKEVLSEKAKKSASLMEQRRQAAEREKEAAIAKTEADAKLHATTVLLHKVLPPSIAQRMIDGEEEIADYFPQVSILFADIAGFTPISADMPAFMVVRFLNYVFREFDRIIEKHGCEKIKTIGDGYMAVSGAPIACQDHAERLAAAALEMQMPIHLPDDIREYLPEGQKFGIRIGLHTGSIVAGVIGEKRFVYDIYSDAVNTAARMESHGEPDTIHVTHDFVRHLQNRFSSTKNTTHGISFEKRGEMEIKGKGLMKTYFLEKA